MKVLALDIGDRRIGLAVSDPTGTIARPLDTIDNINNQAITRIAGVIDEQSIKKIVFGLPITKSGQESEQTRATYEFINRLKEAVGIDCLPIDERFTTRIAKSALKEARFKNNKTKKRYIDQIAAVVILQTYLDSQQT